jgi:hypothetical protein
MKVVCCDDREDLRCGVLVDLIWPHQCERLLKKRQSPCARDTRHEVSRHGDVM